MLIVKSDNLRSLESMKKVLCDTYSIDYFDKGYWHFSNDIANRLQEIYSRIDEEVIKEINQDKKPEMVMSWTGKAKNLYRLLAGKDEITENETDREMEEKHGLVGYEEEVKLPDDPDDHEAEADREADK